MSKDKKVVEKIKKEEKIPKRQIIIETDGNTVQMVKSEVYSKLELLAVLSIVMDDLKNKN